MYLSADRDDDRRRVLNSYAARVGENRTVVDAGDLPAAAGELDPPDAAAGAEVERAAVRRSAVGRAVEH
jgi:hypothetical protein